MWCGWKQSTTLGWRALKERSCVTCVCAAKRNSQFLSLWVFCDFRTLKAVHNPIRWQPTPYCNWFSVRIATPSASRCLNYSVEAVLQSTMYCHRPLGFEVWRFLLLTTQPLEWHVLVDESSRKLLRWRALSSTSKVGCRVASFEAEILCDLCTVNFSKYFVILEPKKITQIVYDGGSQLHLHL